MSNNFLNNKKIASVLQEAIDAPVGSTKRSQARHLAAVLRKSMAEFDGQGGPGYSKYAPSTPGSSFYLTKSPRTDPDFSSTVIHSTPPAPKRPSQMPQSTAPVATDTSATDQSAPQMGPAAPTMATPQSNFGSSGAMPSVTTAFSNIDPIPNDGKGGPGYTYGTDNMSSLMNSAQGGASKPADLSKLTLGGVAQPSVSGILDKGMTSLNLTPATGKRTDPSMLLRTSSPIYPEAPKPTYSAPKPAAPVTPAAPIEQPVTPEPIETPTYTEYPAPTIPGSAPTTGASASQSVQSAVDNNMGAAAFAQSAMADPTILKQIFPNMSETPMSPSLTESVKKIQDSLQEEYNIRGLQSQLQSMVAGGVTLGPILQTYIQNKDTSLNAIDEQRQAAADMMLRSDTGNPYEAQMWGQYMDYLNNLYTNKNATYADFYNKSIGMYNNQLAALNTTMSNAINQYNNELTTGANLTQADYTNMRQSLMDMYTAVQEAPAKQIELATLKAQLAVANGSTVAGAAGIGSGKWSEEYKKLTDNGILFSNEKGSEGALLPDVTNLSQAIQTILSDAPDIGTNGALNIIGQGFIKGIQGLGGDIDKSLAQANTYQQMVLQGAADGSIPQSTALDMTKTIGSAAGKTVYNYLSSDPAKAKATQDAIIYALTGKDRGAFLGIGNSGRPPTLAQFQAKFGKTLPGDLGVNLYQSLLAARQAIERSYRASQDPSNTGAGATAWYGGMTPDQVVDGWVEEVGNLSDPHDIASYASDSISSLIGGVATQALSLSGS